MSENKRSNNTNKQIAPKPQSGLPDCSFGAPGPPLSAFHQAFWVQPGASAAAREPTQRDERCEDSFMSMNVSLTCECIPCGSASSSGATYPQVLNGELAVVRAWVAVTSSTPRTLEVSESISLGI